MEHESSEQALLLQVELIASQQGWEKQTGSAPSLCRCEAKGNGEGQGTAGLSLTSHPGQGKGCALGGTVTGAGPTGDAQALRGPEPAFGRSPLSPYPPQPACGPHPFPCPLAGGPATSAVFPGPGVQLRRFLGLTLTRAQWKLAGPMQDKLVWV